jgi:methionine-S-sulfoxide reductase
MPTASSTIEGTSLLIAPGDFPDPMVDLPLASPGTPPATAILAGGCFWCTEAVYRELDGVLGLIPGYAGGARETADYKTVSTGRTKHAEAIRITYDPSQINFEQLLDVFFDAHDPTQLNRQGNDIGTQYRSAIFYANEDERQIAAAKIQALNDSLHFAKPIATTLEPLSEFYLAEDYHQDYARQNPGQPYIQSVSMPKVCKVREKHAGLLRK